MLLTNFKNLISGILLNINCNVVNTVGNTITLTPSEMVGADGFLNNGFIGIGRGDDNIHKDMYTYVIKNKECVIPHYHTEKFAENLKDGLKN